MCRVTSLIRNRHRHGPTAGSEGGAFSCGTPPLYIVGEIEGGRDAPSVDVEELGLGILDHDARHQPACRPTVYASGFRVQGSGLRA